jgi:hypothetical protein
VVVNFLHAYAIFCRDTNSNVVDLRTPAPRCMVRGTNIYEGEMIVPQSLNGSGQMMFAITIQIVCTGTGYVSP